MNQIVGREVAVLRVGAMTEEAHSIGNAQPPSLAFVSSKLRMADDNEPGGRLSDESKRFEQRREPLQTVVHGNEEADRVVRRNAPALALVVAALEPIIGRETQRINGAVNDPHRFRRHAVILLEMPLNHAAVDDQEVAARPEILLAFQRANDHAAGVEPFAEFGQSARYRVSILEQVVRRAGRVQPPLGIKNVLPPCLVEADADIVRVVARALARRPRRIARDARNADRSERRGDESAWRPARAAASQRLA